MKQEIIQNLIGLVNSYKIPVSDPDLEKTAEFFSKALAWLKEELEKESNGA